jgi:hypothetical protein
MRVLEPECTKLDGCATILLQVCRQSLGGGAGRGVYYPRLCLSRLAGIYGAGRGIPEAVRGAY